MNGDPPDKLQPDISSVGWMVTFTDLVSLMLTFFVMLFAMSHVGIGKWESITDSLSLSLNPGYALSAAPTSARHSISTTFRKRAINLDYLSVVLDETIHADPLLQTARLVRYDDRLVIVLPGDLLFESDSSVLSEKARKAVFDIGGVLRNIGNEIAVKGHTDPAAPSSRYVSNWELSTARAIAVRNALRRSGYDRDMLAFGVADSAFATLPDLPEDQKRALARRVDIVILPDVAED
jgi:chemotaxis protein MotB